LVCLLGSIWVDSVGRVRGGVERNEHLACTITVVVTDGDTRAVDR
jgi:hypothetical protein